MNRFAMFGVVATLATAGLANAASVTYSAPYSISPIGGIDTPVLPYWSGNPGDLTGVSLWIDGEVTGTYTFVSGTNPGDTAEATLAGTVFASYTPTGSILFDSATTGLLAPALNPGDSAHVGVLGGTNNYAALSLSHGPFAYVLAPWIGVGTFDVDVTSVGGWTFQVNGSSEQGSATVQFGSSVDGNVYVRYEYVPEPASLALLGLGGLALIRRRRA